MWLRTELAEIWKGLWNFEIVGEKGLSQKPNQAQMNYIKILAQTKKVNVADMRVQDKNTSQKIGWN